MILESLQKANSTILDSVQVTSNKQAAKAFKDQVMALGQCTAQLEPLLSLISALQERKIAEKAFTQDIKNALQNSVDLCGQKTDEHTLDAGTVTALRNSIELCRKNIEIEWKSDADGLASGVEQSLSSLRGLLPNKQEVDDLLAALDKGKVTIPGSAKGIDLFLDNVNRGKEMVDGLHLDDEVDEFVRKVRRQQATVSDLTPHIMEWLKDNQLTNQIKVRFS